jgi:hypothetical protein
MALSAGRRRRVTPSIKRAHDTALHSGVWRAKLLSAVWLAGVTTILTVVLANLLAIANGAYAKLNAPGGYLLLQAPVMWYMIAAFVGFCVAVLTGERAHSLFLGASPATFGPDSLSTTASPPRMVYGTYRVALVLFSFVAILSVRKYGVLTESAIVDQRAMALSPQEYKYADVSHVTMAFYFMPATKYRPSGISTVRAMYVWLNDGRRWSIKDSELYAPEETQESLAETIAQRCHLAVAYPLEPVGIPNPVELRARGQKVAWYPAGFLCALGLWLTRKVWIPFLRSRSL